ncbi:MAG: SDR family NAD(P)-dependent oxidoreductase [Candidatus Acidiferrales bacterium]
MKGLINKKRFGPWALVTGASSGIGREFARQIAASGINVVLVARREALLDEVGKAIAKDFKVQYRTVVADLSQAGFLENLAKATDDLDIGLVVSNAGTGNPGEFLKIDREELESLLRVNTLAHLDIAHHFGQKLASRGHGGLLLVGAMGASNGVPYMANDGAAKAYVHSFGEALHVELKPLGVHVTVLPPGLTETPVIAKFGLSPDTMPMKPMKVEQCVSEGLKALEENRSMIIPGRLNRIMNAVVPGSVARRMAASMLRKTLANRPAKAQPQAKPQTQPQPKPR